MNLIDDNVGVEKLFEYYEHTEKLCAGKQRKKNNKGRSVKYTVKNTYRDKDDVRGQTTHRKPETALKARDKREGVGWIVIDEQGNEWDWFPPNYPGEERKPYIYRHHDTID